MKKIYFLISLFAISFFLSACATTNVESEEIGLKGQSYNNPNVIVLKEKPLADVIVNGGEFYRFDFKAFKDVLKDGRFGMVEVLNKHGERISLYTIGYHKNHFYDTFYISPNAATVNIALSDSENSFKKVKESFKVKNLETSVCVFPVKILDNGKDGITKIPNIIAGDFNTFDFSMFNSYFNDKVDIENKNIYGIIECYGEYGRLINRISYSTSNFAKKSVLIPAKTNKIILSVSGSDDEYYTPIDMVAVKTNYQPITIESFIASSFRTLDLNKYQKDIKDEYGIIEYLDGNYKVIYKDFIKNDGNGNLKGKVYIPRDAVWANIARSSDSYNYKQTFDYIDILSSTNSSPLVIPSSYYTSSKVKGLGMNEQLSEFIKYLNIETFNKDKAEDLFIDYIVKRADLIATNDFERVKLYHDAVLCLLSSANEQEEIIYKKHKEIIPKLLEKAEALSAPKSFFWHPFKYKKIKNEFLDTYYSYEDEILAYRVPLEYFVYTKDGNKKMMPRKQIYKYTFNAYIDAVKKYDKIMESYNNTVKDYKAILKNRNGARTSDAYALLFREFCSRSNIPCLVIAGHQKKYDSKGYGWSFEDGSPVNHYWNIVLIENEAYLVDVNMDALEMKKNVNKTALKKDEKPSEPYSDKWMFAEPKEFIELHYPINTEFQLLKNPVSEKDYLLKNPNKVKKPSSKNIENKAAEESNINIPEEELSKKELKKLEKQAKKDAKEKEKQDKELEKAAKAEKKSKKSE